MNTLISARFLYLSALLLATCLLPAGPVLAQGGDPWLEQAKLVAADGAANEEFGASVALDGDTAVVGVWQAEIGDNQRQGAVYILTRSGEDWTQVAKLTASDGAADDRFGASVALDGATILVGAFENDEGMGAVYVFVDNGTAWTEQAKLVAATGQPGDDFGFSVALDGDTALVGANRADVEGFDNGAAYVFTRDGAGTWTEQARVVPDEWPFGECSPSSTCPRFGHSVALEEGTAGEVTAIVGASNQTVDGVLLAGAAYIFVLDAGEWIQQAKLTRSEPAQRDVFGTSVALWGDIALIGAPEGAFNGNGGMVHAFTRAGGIWSEQQILTASDGAAGDLFGQSVALLDNSAVIGAWAQFSGRPGAAYVYALESGSWNEQRKLEASDGAGEDQFGVSMTLSGDTALVGARRAVDANGDQGAAYVFVAAPAGNPFLEFIPAALDFGDVEVGQTSAAQTATLSNSGDAEATGLAFNPPGNGFAADTGDCPATLAAGADCQISVTFAPAAAGPADNTLIVNGDNELSASLDLSGNGQDPGVLAVTPAVLDLGPVELGSTGTRNATVSNTAGAGAATLTLSAIDLTGDPEFSLAGGSCSIGTELAPGANCSVTIEFGPGSEGDFVAALQVTTGDGQDVGVDVAGTGVQPPEPFADWLPQAMLLEPDDGQMDSFGFRLALDGNTALVGQSDPGPVISTSRAYVFERDGETWGEPFALLPAEHPLVCPTRTKTGDQRICPQFGWSVAIEGDIAVVGQPWSRSGAALAINPRQPQGAAYVFERQGDQWVEQTKLMAADGHNGDDFGWSVAISGDTIVVGAPTRVAQQPDRPVPDPHGAAYVFVRQGDDWVEQARLFHDDFPLLGCPRNDDGGPDALLCRRYGSSVAIEGDTVLVGTPGEGLGPDPDARENSRKGSVYVFTRDGGAWSQQAKLVASDGNHGHSLGSSVAFQGETALIGAPSAGDEPMPNDNPGAAYVFTRSGTTWTEQQRLLPSDGGGFDLFSGLGNGVGLAGDIALVGANRHDVDSDDPEQNQGAAFLYTRNNGTWTERQRLTIPLPLPPGTDCSGTGCRFGRGIALSGNTALAGATNVRRIEGGQNVGEGAVFVFTAPPVELGFFPSSMNFGAVPLGRISDPVITTLLNNGEQDLTGLAFTTPGEGFITDTSACGTTLAVGEDCEISITFTPDIEGPASATLQVDSDQGLNDSVSLSGFGLEMPDQIFHNRFEIGSNCSISGANAWDSAVGASLAAGSPADGHIRYAGPCSLKVTVHDVSPSWAEVDNQQGEQFELFEETFNVRFYVFLDGVTTGDSLLFEADDLLDDPAVSIWYQADAGVLEFDIAGAAGPVLSDPLGSGWHSIEFAWKSEDGGEFLYSIDGAPDQAIPADTGDLHIGSARLGNLVSVDGAGEMYFDDFDARRRTRPGRLPVGDASGSGSPSIGDAVAILSELNSLGLAAGQPDCNEDGSVAITDAVCLLSLLSQ